MVYGNSQAGMTPEQQAYWDQQAPKQMSTLGYSWQPVYDFGYGGFQTQQELDDYRTRKAADDKTRMVWNGAAGQYMTAEEALAYGQGPNANQNIVFGGSPTKPSSGGNMTGGVTPSGTSVAQSAGYSPPQPAAGSATATNPFLNLGLNAFTNTQQPWNADYLKPLATSLWNQAGQQWNDVINPSLDNSAILAGGYGGDRAALAKGVAADRLNQSVFNALAPQYAQGYENWANRGLQGGTAAAGIGTGLEQLDLSRLGTMGNLGLGMYNADTTRQLGLGDLANKNYLAEAQVANWANQVANPQYTNPFGAAIGGGLLGWQVLNSILNPQK